ncbi:hypothetical protein CPB85DRAFT_1377940 [Mucidula mucida]|nr:hypothetical protein CPB85DRAFT_1377940 [Mucidula mucida]
MFASLVVFGFVASAFASPLKRFDGLTVTLSGPATNVSSIADLKFTATVTNSGTDDAKILKYGTILDDTLPTRSFTVTKDGETVPFTGVKITVSLEDADDSAYAFIAAGETITVQHDVSSLFDFSSAGQGTFTFEPVTNFRVATPEASIISESQMDRIEASAESIDVFVSGDLAKRELHERNKRAVNICTNASRKSFIDSSYTEAKALASGASSYISSNGANSLYTAYWGTNSQSTIRGVFNGVANEASSSRTLSCTDSYGVCTGGVIAYTVIATTNIYYCSIFFNEVPSTSLCSGTTVASRNVRGGTTLHEITHAVSGTDDVTYGCAADQALSTANKRINADNYNCFATQVYANTQC